jgi:hypothetical protein
MKATSSLLPIPHEMARRLAWAHFLKRHEPKSVEHGYLVEVCSKVDSQIVAEWGIDVDEDDPQYANPGEVPDVFRELSYLLGHAGVCMRRAT